MAIMLLKENNKLKYDDEINEYLIELPYENITIRNLLNHTSGLPDYGNRFSKHSDINEKQKKVVSNKDVNSQLKKYSHPLLSKPCNKYQYSNTGYTILALSM